MHAQMMCLNNVTNTCVHTDMQFHLPNGDILPFCSSSAILASWVL